MNMETIKETVNTSMYIGHERKKINVEGDVNVPDIKPDILSIVSVSGGAYITKKEITENKIRVDGTVDVCLIYVSDDEYSTLRGINNTFNFTEYIDLAGVSDNSFVKMKCVSGALECKVVNGRKVSVKCPVTLDVEACKEQKYEIGKDIVDDRKIELKKENIHFKTLYNCKCEDTTINETINFNENDEPIGEILQAKMKIVGKDYKTSYNKILAKAEAIVKIVYIADNDRNSVETFETKIPVMGFIDVDGLTDNMEICLDYAIKSFNVKPVYQDLKATAIAVDSEIQICAFIYHTVNFDVISDLYSLDKNLKMECDAIKVLENNVNASESIEMIQSLLVPELDMLKILDIEANPVISEVNVLDGKLAIEGNIEFNILYYRNDKKVLETKKMELPFQQVIKVAALQSDMKPQIDLEISDLEHKAIGGNQMQIQLKLNVSILNHEEQRINSIKEVEVLEEAMPKMPSMVVYYVKEGDSLWKIAKKFKVTIDEIKAINELKEDTIYPNQQLLIQRKGMVNKVEALL